MIFSITLAVCITVVLLTLIQAVLVLNYQSFMRRGIEDRFIEPDSGDAFTPKVAVVLCVRGEDPTLIECLSGIIGQDYPDFQLHVAFDSEHDPGATVVRDFFEGHHHQARLYFFDALTECSLKCSGISHIVESLDHSFEVVAFIDADAVVDENWLAELVRPLDDEATGAATGNRWFTPTDDDTGSLVQQTWNAAAVVQMQAYDIAWGGSLAIRRDVIDRCELVQRWRESFCEDTVLSKAFRRSGYRIARVPGLVIDNQENNDLDGTYDWIVRQLLTVRLHHTHWFDVMTHGLATGVATIVVPVLAIVCVASGNFAAANAAFRVWILYQVVNVVLLWLIGRSNKFALQARPGFRPDDHDNQASLSNRIWAGLVTQWAHPMATFAAMTATRTTWRGASYAVLGNRVRLINFNDRNQQHQESDSEPDDPDIIRIDSKNDSTLRSRA